MGIHFDASESALVNYLAGTTGLGDDAALRRIDSAMNWPVNATTKSGLWTGGPQASTSGSVASTIGRLGLVPWTVAAPVSYDRVAIRITIAGDATFSLAVGLYSLNDECSLFTRVKDWGVIPGNSLGVVEVSGATPVLAPGAYAVALLALGSGTSPTIQQNTGVNSLGCIYPGMASVFNEYGTLGRFVADGFSALPETVAYSSLSRNSTYWNFCLRVA